MGSAEEHARVQRYFGQSVLKLIALHPHIDGPLLLQSKTTTQWTMRTGRSYSALENLHVRECNFLYLVRLRTYHGGIDTSRTHSLQFVAHRPAMIAYTDRPTSILQNFTLQPALRATHTSIISLDGSMQSLLSSLVLPSRNRTTLRHLLTWSLTCPTMSLPIATSPV